MTQTPVVVVGGGAAGMMAALAARRAGARDPKRALSVQRGDPVSAGGRDGIF